MLKKERRVKKDFFSKPSPHSKILHTDLFSLKYFKENTKNTSKIAFVLPKKILPKATERNKLKRRSHNIVEKVFDNIKPGFVLVFYMKKGIERANFSDLSEEILFSLKKIEVL